MDTFRHIAAKFAAHYETLYREHGDSSLALNWKDEGELLARYGAILDVVRPADLPVTLLDFGCGLSHLYDYIRGHSPLAHLIEYSGWDISKTFVGVCREKHPDLTFYQLDVFHPDDLCQVPTFDYVVGCGVFTEKLHTP